MISLRPHLSLSILTSKSIFRTAALVFLMTTLLSACDNKAPTELAFVGPTSGRNSDLGIDGRNGFILAIEQKNMNGGINGQNIEYQIHDDQHDKDAAIEIFKALADDDKVTATVGPMTSYVATSAIDIIRNSNKVTISPTVTTPDLSDVDDTFFRVLSTTSTYAVNSSNFLIDTLGMHSASIIYDIGNKSYTQSWVDYFTDSFTSMGGEISSVIPYTSSSTLVVDEYINELMASSGDTLIIVANSMDTSLFIQKIRSREKNDQTILVAEWAGTERLLELSGKNAEGIYIPQYIDRDSQNPDYLSFRKDYITRFSNEPGFASITSFNATHTILKAIESQNPNESLKDTLLRIRGFGGIQTPVNFNEFGENEERMYMVRVINGKFATQ